MILIAAAFAAPTVPTIALGLDVGTNDPFAFRFGPRATGAVQLFDQLELQAFGAWYPTLGEGGCGDPAWTPLACEVLTEASVAPDISLIVGRLGANMAWLPLRTTGTWETAAGLYGGFGVVYTDDDLVALGQPDEPRAKATEKEWHLAPQGGLVADLHRDNVGFRLRFEITHYTEVIATDTEETKNPAFLGADTYLRF